MDEGERPEEKPHEKSPSHKYLYYCFIAFHGLKTKLKKTLAKVLRWSREYSKSIQGDTGKRANEVL